MVYAFKTPTLEQIGKSLVADHLRDVAALKEPFPVTVSYAHFIRRDLAAAIESGRCTVTMPHPAFASMPGIPVVDVARTDDGRGYILITADGSEWKRYAKGDLAVTWIDFGDTWAKLSWPMRWAIRHLAGEYAKKPRHNTLKALASRGLVANGQLTSSALALYRQNKSEFTHV